MNEFPPLGTNSSRAFIRRPFDQNDSDRSRAIAWLREYGRCSFDVGKYVSDGPCAPILTPSECARMIDACDALCGEGVVARSVDRYGTWYRLVKVKR